MASHKKKVGEQVNLSASGSVIISRQGNVTIPIEIRSIHFNRALFDLGASINLMPLSIFEKLKLRNLKNTKITLQLANKSLVHPKGVLEDVLVKVHILDFEEDRDIRILLGKPFMVTSRSAIDLEKNELTMKINGETEIFNCGYQLNQEERRILGEHCKKLFISNVPKSIGMLPFMNAERINKFKEWDKWAKVEWHNGRWTNTDRINKSSTGES
ncbi:Retrovirus-related Pol polyprotein from transposon opus [Gossypium australe]|uniref:Retrovirus-related Pol polyprotein from transposon opus n=1 Tax=Gossypium australe TaxID=47621 RepID=A0A5B6UAN3_9ROSI|nr:Retrovirus-related Pol polyprotein from transposon opus [Gossypium australe]